MLYYLVKYRHTITFCFVFILEIVIEILTGLINSKTDIFAIYALIGGSALIALTTMVVSLIFYDTKGHKLISNKITGILKKYINKPKKFDFFYKEFVSSNTVSLIDSILKRYKDLGMTDKDVYTKLWRYKSFIRKTVVTLYDEAINVLSISTLFDEHIQLINEVFYKSNEIDVAQKKVLEEKDEKLAKILEEELATKSKDFKRFGEYYS